MSTFEKWFSSGENEAGIPYTKAGRFYHYFDRGKAGEHYKPDRYSLWHITLRTSVYRSYRFAAFLNAAEVKIFSVPILDVIDDLRKLIHLVLLIFLGVRIVESPLLKRIHLQIRFKSQQFCL